jgi:hypothetical protein
VAEGRFDLPGIHALLGRSRLGDELAEGLYIRKNEEGRLVGRAKLVRPEFVQSIDEHWSKTALETNALADTGRRVLASMSAPISQRASRDRTAL